MEKSQLKEAVAHGTVRFPLAVYEWNTDNGWFQVKLHWHEETEIIFFEQGTFEVMLNMERRHVQAPALMLVAAGDIHAIRARAACLEKAIVFDLKMLSFEHFDEVQYQLMRPLLEQKVQLSRIIFPQQERWGSMKELFLKTLRAAGEEGLGARMRVKAGLYELLALLYENGCLSYAGDEREYDTFKIANTKKILSYIQENLGRQITARDMAAQLGMNPQYFCRYFKKLFGKTPTGYCNEIRIEKAAELLLESERKIIDIAMSCGYENMGYFIRRFTRQKGMTPSLYRRRGRELLSQREEQSSSKSGPSA